MTNRQYDSSLHGQWLSNARNVTHSRGNNPGFPNQWQYLNEQTDRSNEKTGPRMEYNTMYVNEEVDIKQQRRDRSIIGEYKAMVPDLPFNQSYDTEIRNRTVLLGFGAIILGSLLFV